MIRRMSVALTVLVLAACFGTTPISRRQGTFEPKQPGWTYDAGVLAFQGSPLYRVVQTDVDRLTTHYAVQAMDGSVQASVTFASSYQDTLECRAEFPSLGVHYEARIPIVPFTTLLASFVDNGVLTEAGLTQPGLDAYAASRGIALIDTAAQTKRLSEAGSRAICQSCTEDYRACQVEASMRRKHPRPGVTVTTSCEAQFQACSQGGFVARADDWPCGTPAP
jgi:hypothetical protein